MMDDMGWPSGWFLVGWLVAFTVTIGAAMIAIGQMT